MRVTQVFTPGSFPEYTFINEHIEGKKRLLLDTLETGTMAVSISGPSKSGKTVFVQEAVGKDNLIHVTGAGIESPASLWARVFDIIGTAIPQSNTEESSFVGSVGTKVGGSIGAIIAKGFTEVEAKGNWGDKTVQSSMSSIDPLQLLIKELKNAGYVLFIDDFHYISRSTQGEIAKQIKEAIRQGVKIICASVPYHSDDVIKSNADLRGRIVGIDFDYWDASLLKKIAEKGFAILNIEYEQAFADRASKEAAGSPQLMQSICLNSCFESNIREDSERRKLDNSEEFYNNTFSRTALSADYRSTISKMQEGPKVRGEPRKQYRLKDGTQSDVYPLLLKALALNPPALTMRYAELTRRVSELVQSDEDSPSGSSITGACLHISSLANESSGQNVIEWDSENDVLDIQDPYLLFFLRWKDI